MSVSIIVPLIVLAILLIGVFVWYRRSITAMQPGEARSVSGVRLTAEALHRAPAPPWKVVYEVGGALGDVDHVIIGPPGVVAITTIVADRPEPDQLRGARGDAVLVSEAAVARGPLDELLRAASASCDWWARVHWGTPDLGRPAADELVHGSLLVEGQRIDEWLTTMVGDTAAPLDEGRITAIWRMVVIGIGRPDPLP